MKATTQGVIRIVVFDENRNIRRSPHALLLDRSDIADDVNTTEELFDALAEEDCILFAHVGGRPVNIVQADGGALRTAVEVHSDWGTFVVDHGRQF